MTIEPIDYTAPGSDKQFVKSLKETGFGVLRNHPISESLVSSIYKHWQAFFDGKEKQSYHYNIDTQDGFFPTETSEVAKGNLAKDIKEYFHYYHWGQCPPELKDEIKEYYDSTVSFANELLDWVEKYSPPEVSKLYREPLSAMMKGSAQSLLRVLHYPPLDGSEAPNAIRAAAHEDINLLTILPAATEPGLQVLTREGDWIDVPCEFNTLVINTGDMLQEASGGYFPSTTHRVINPASSDRSKSRISLPLFLHPRKEVVLSDRHTAGSYLQERLKELGVI
jgi:isopenicillin N synthase-like dioxygenase